MKLMHSRLWPVVAYAVMGLWLILVNAENLGFSVTKPGFYGILAEFDSVAHFSVALSLAVVSREMVGRSRTIQWMLVLFVGWEVFEVLSMPSLAATTLDQVGPVYYFDTLQDVAMGVFGLLVGISVVEK